MGSDPTGRLLATNIAAARALFEQLGDLSDALTAAARLIQTTLLEGRKVLCCGNGGSAADCAHLTTELAGRYLTERRGYCAIDLTANSSLVTALINDYPPEQIFARQVESLGARGDVLIALSTSGNSANVVAAIAAAKTYGLKTIALLGDDGGKCRGMADIEMVVPSAVTARVQEAHLFLYHNICEAIDAALAQG